MKKIFAFLVIALLITASIFAQTPQKLSYQSVIRDASGKLITNQTVNVKISILKGSATGTEVYSETQAAKTNTNGLISIEIGGNAKFEAIDWSNSSFYIKTETDPTGGTNYTITGTSQLLSVPYALYAQKAANAFSGNYADLSNKPVIPSKTSELANDAGFITSYTETDPSFTASIAKSITSADTARWNLKGNSVNISLSGQSLGDMLYYNGTAWVRVPAGSNGDLLLINNGKPTWNSIVPKVSTGAAQNVTSSTATFSGSITNHGIDNNSDPYLNYLYATHKNPNENDKAFGGSVGESTTITGLKASTTYYVKASAHSQLGRGYGEEVSFTTLPASLPSFGSYIVSDSSSSTIRISCSDINNGGDSIISKGWCWSTSENPTIALATKDYGSEVVATGLSPATKYYLRPFATNSIGTSYGKQITVKTTALGAPVFSSIWKRSILSVRAEIEIYTNPTDGIEITEQGVCWSTSHNPTVSDNKAQTRKYYGYALTGLTPATKYYYRAYAINASGIFYSKEDSLTTTEASLPTLSTNTGVAYRTFAISGGSISNEGDKITARGVCWNTTGSPTIADSKTISSSTNVNFTDTLKNLTANTTYFVRAYATNSKGTSYGNVLALKTTSGQPTFGDCQIQGIYATSATIHAFDLIASSNNETITEYGFCWSTSKTPSTTNKVIAGGDYEVFLTGLTPSTKYYYSIYAINAAGTFYSKVDSFTTTSGAPTFGNFNINSIGASIATITIDNVIESSNGESISEQGFCCSTSKTPKTTDNKVKVSNSTSVSFMELTPLTKYYYSAYAINAAGTFYSKVDSFTTIAKTASITILDPNDASTYGTLPSNVTVVDTLGKKAFRVVLNGWNTTIPTSTTVNTGANLYMQASVLLDTTQTYQVDRILCRVNAFVGVQLQNTNTERCAFSGILKEAQQWVNISASNSININVTGVQIYIQERDTWNAISGPVIYISKIEITN
jgi:hypothetical protein